ncbi:hypothetical protein TpMuguga_02g00216 [Theileria parva strain Muguga]|uniref:uncharacterized protein n=1 Tax=Theileria parva strain Muguga TaxID=333668 RepID=UPI001C624279|nr:uncharacterized protein TpMuguga_02g00216 [Theileria parva strain Muguga]EAN32499.2 hypothetical protein TpMuguga_02g00216 [Theileria parva strain Muguga]
MVTIVPNASNKIVKVVDKQRQIWNRTSVDEFLSELKLYRLYGEDRLLFIVSVVDNVKYVKFYIKQGVPWIETSMEDFNSSFEAIMKTRAFELRAILDTDTFMIQRQIFSGIPAYVFTPYNVFDVVIVCHNHQIIWSCPQISDKCIRIIVHGDLDKPLLLNISILHDYKSLSSEKFYPGGRLTQQFDIMRMHLSREFVKNVRLAKKRAGKSQKDQKDTQDETGTGTQQDVEQTSKDSKKSKGGRSSSQGLSEQFELVDQVQTDQQKIKRRKIYYSKKKELQGKISKLKYQLFITDDLLELEKKLDREDDVETSESDEDDYYDDIHDKSEQPKEKSKNKKVKELEKILAKKQEELAELEGQLEKLNSLNLTGVLETFNASSIKQNLLEKISAMKYEILKIEELLKLEKYIIDTEPCSEVEIQDKKTYEKDQDKDKETSETDSSDEVDDDEDQEEDDYDESDDYDDYDDGYERGGDSDDGSGAGNGNAGGESSNQNEDKNSAHQYEDKSEETSTKHKKIEKIEKELILRRKKIKRLRRDLRSLEKKRFTGGIKEYLEAKEHIDNVNAKIESIQYSVFQFKEMIKLLKKSSLNGSSKQLKEMRREKIKELQKQSDEYSKQLSELQKELEKLEEENSGQIDSEELDTFIQKELETQRDQVLERQREQLYKRIDCLHFDIRHFKNAIRIEKQHDDCHKSQIYSKIRRYESLLEKKQKELQAIENDLLIVESKLQKSGTQPPDHHHQHPPEPVKSIRKVAWLHKSRPTPTKIPPSINTNYFRFENIFPKTDKPRQFTPRFTVPLPQVHSRLSGPFGQYQTYHPQQQNSPYQPRDQIPQGAQGSGNSSGELVPEIVTLEDSSESDSDCDIQPSCSPQQSGTEQGAQQGAQNVYHYQHYQPPQQSGTEHHQHVQHYQPYHPPQQSGTEQGAQQGGQHVYQYQPYNPQQQLGTEHQQQQFQQYQTYTPTPQQGQPGGYQPQQSQGHFGQFGAFRPYRPTFQSQHGPTVQQQQEYPGQSGAFIPYQHYKPRPETYQANFQQTDQHKELEPVDESQQHLPLKKRIRLDKQPSKTGPYQTEQIEPDPRHKAQQQVGYTVTHPGLFTPYSENLQPGPKVQPRTQTGTTGQKPSQQQVSGPQTRIRSYRFPVPPTLPVPPFTPQNSQTFGNTGEPSGLPPLPPIEPYPHKSVGNREYIEERYYKNTENGWVRIQKIQYIHLMNKYDYQKAMGSEPSDSDS